MKLHLEACGRGTPPPSQTYTLSPNEALWPNSELRCFLCGGRALMIAHPVSGKPFGSCAKWDDERHRNREAQLVARRADRAAQTAAGAGGHVVVRPIGEQVIDWVVPLQSLGGSREEELAAWTGEYPGWRAADERAELLETLARRLVITDKSGYYDRLESKLSLVDPANVPTLRNGVHYYEMCESVQTLARCGGDEMFGGISPLTSLFAASAVESHLLVAIHSKLRLVKSTNRKAASGAESRLVVSRESRRRSTDTRGLGLINRNLRESGVLMGSALKQRRRWLDLGFGLRTRVDGMRILVQRLPRMFQIADGRAVADLDCDFGGLGNLETIYQALNVKLDGERLVDDATTRVYARPANLAVARALQTLGHGDQIFLQICRHGWDIAEYPINRANWRAEMGAAALHHLELHDKEVYDRHVAADPDGWADRWTGGLLVEDGCGGVIYGLPFSLIIDGERYGRCPLTDPLFRTIADSLDRTAYRIASDQEYNWDRDQPRDNPSVLPRWPGDRSMREAFLRTGALHADDGYRLAAVEIIPRVDAAFAIDDGDVAAALHEGYAAIAHGAKAMGPRAFLDDVRQRYVDNVAPTVLEELGRERRFVITTYDLGALDDGPVASRDVFVPRTGLDDLLAPPTARLPEMASSPARGDVDALTHALQGSPGHFSAEDDDGGAALPEVPKSRSRHDAGPRRRRPPDGSTQPDPTVRSLDKGGFPPLV